MIIEVADEAALQAFAGKLAHHLKGGEAIELVGDVGAGKTSFVKGLAKGLGVDEDVQSPSFTISWMYQTARPDLLLAHYDFYRLHDPGIMASELDEVVNDKGVVTVVEWAEIVNDVLPDGHVRVTIIPTSETARRVVIEGIEA